MTEAREELGMSRAERLGPNWARRTFPSGLQALLVSGFCPLVSWLFLRSLLLVWSHSRVSGSRSDGLLLARSIIL